MAVISRLAFAGALSVLSLACSSSGSSGPGTTGSPDAATGGMDAAPFDGSSAGIEDATSPADSAADTATAPAMGDDGSAATGGDGSLADVFAPVPDGGELVQFVTSDETTYFDPAQENKATGTITFGAPNAAASDKVLPSNATAT